MSKYIKRVGKKSRHFSVNMHLKDLTLCAGFSKAGPIRVVWTRGAKIARSKWGQADNTGDEKSEISSVYFNEQLTLVTTMFYNEKDDQKPFEKKSKIEIVQQRKDSKSPTRIGKYTFDLSTYTLSDEPRNHRLLFAKKWKDCISLSVTITTEMVRELELREKTPKGSPKITEKESPKDNLPEKKADTKDSNPFRDSETTTNPFLLSPFVTQTNPFLNGAKDVISGSVSSMSGLTDKNSMTGSDYYSYSDMGDVEEDKLTPPVVKGMSKEEQQKLTINWYERQMSKYREQVQGLKEKVADSAAYASRMEVELVNAKVALCNQVDEYFELEIKYQNALTSLEALTHENIKRKSNLFS